MRLSVLCVTWFNNVGVSTCVEGCMVLTPLVQLLASLPEFSLLSSSSVLTWPLPSWPAQSSTLLFLPPLQLQWVHHPPPPLLLHCWKIQGSQYPNFLLLAWLCQVECEYHNMLSFGHWKRYHWPPSPELAPSSCRDLPAGHTSRERRCNSWLCGTEYTLQNRAVCKCSR